MELVFFTAPLERADAHSASALFFLFILLHLFVVSMRCDCINNKVHDRKGKYNADGTPYENLLIDEVHCPHQVYQCREGRRGVQSRHCQGQEEYLEDLPPDGRTDFVVRHSDFLHNLEPLSVVETLCDLLIIDNQRYRQQEEDGQKQSDKEEGAEPLIVVRP